MSVLLVIPAHNEAQNIVACLRGAQDQTIPVDILVVSDNCSDNTAAIARSMGICVFETVNNTHRKAGALNQALYQFVDKYDYILIQDADTTIDPRLLSVALDEMEDCELGAVCSKAGIKDISPATWSEELLWRLQRIEYAIFDSSRIETLGAIRVIHGMAAMYRSKALLTVKNKWGRIYDENNITEDYELTVCLRELGWKTTTCMNMKAWTAVPLTLMELWIQRVRWFRGGVDVLRTHDLNHVTLHEFGQHLLFILLTTLNLIIMGCLGYLLVSGSALDVHPLFYLVVAVTTLDGMYRLGYIENLHPKEIIIRLSVLPFSIYMMLYQAQQIWAYWLSLRKSNQGW